MSMVWIQALFAAAPRIAGVRLRPYSLAHNFTLRSLDNSLLADGVPDKAEDLATALVVCSRSFAQIQADLFGGAQTVGQLASAIKWKRRYSLATACASFRQYRDNFCACPDHWNEQGAKAGRNIAAPWEWHVVRVLCSQYGRTWDQAWDTPCGQGRCCFDVWAESKGDSTLVSEHEEQAIEEAQRGDGIS